MYNIEDLTERARRSGCIRTSIWCADCRRNTVWTASWRTWSEGTPVRKRLRACFARDLAKGQLCTKDWNTPENWIFPVSYEESAADATYSSSRARFPQLSVCSARAIPRLDSLGLPPSALEFTSLHKGIVLVTGETGSGKSTTLAAMLDEINHTRKNHIVTSGGSHRVCLHPGSLRHQPA